MLSLAVLLCNLILIIKEIKIKNEFKQWKKENDSLDGILFKNIESNNDELLKKFELNHLKMTFITSVYKTYDVMFKIKIKNWKKQFHKLSKNKLDNEFYYFLIFNYNDIAFEDKVFKINDYSYVYKNRDKLFNTTK
ncbi:MAG0920 family protein [Metamycoplasma gateae]|uniref:Uncharacterized protein n=1 Tax=Metamycoplasma gateae TaxID=35769 RepID=A0ABZ2AGX5_9BACT|nr:hypothetical protein V2E26_01655 [Metamycoplasma gateae]